MKTNLMALIQHPHITKICSIILAYSIWFCVAQHQIISQSYKASIFFYDTANKQFQAPDAVQITLQGSRKELYNFKEHHATIHLDGSKLHTGEQEIILTRENLFLPDTLKLVDLVPSHISIQVN
jgi:hypothetical protein